MRARLALFAAAGLLPLAASAHSFGKLYNLPVPLWLYLYGATAALAASFVVMAWFSTQPPLAATTVAAAAPRAWPGWAVVLLRVAQAVSVALLLLMMFTGFAGSQNAYANFNMSGFWIGFVLGFAYLTAVLGNLYARLNPWRVLVRVLERFTGPWQGQLSAPERLGVWPAFVLYLAFIWLELFGETGPRGLSMSLMAYTALNLVGAWWLGTAAWFRQGELFAVFLRTLALCAPLVWSQGRVHWRWPFAGLLAARSRHVSELLFILFMLSSTAFDGLRETLPWVKLFWQDLYAPLWAPLLGDDRVASFSTLTQIFAVWQSAALLLSPLVYLAVYLLCLELARRCTGRSHSLRELALRFAPTLVPIALVYHVTHYYTLLFTQGSLLPWLLADPLGTGSEWAWAWLGRPKGFIPDAGVVWHTQVGLILLGHIVSVVLAHRVALELFITRRAATISQLPMLLLMMLYTGSGLWILAQPLNPGGH